MKRLILLSIFLGLSVAISVRKELDRFKPRGEYVYRSEMSTLTGIPRSSKLYSGSKLVCTVRFQFMQNNDVRMLVEPEFRGHLNRKLENIDPRSILPDRAFDMTESMDTEFVRQLKRPLTFKYMNGIVSNLKTDTRDSIEVVNVKRGMVSKLQIAINKKFSFPENEHYRRMSRGVDYFKTMEETVVGKCEQIYTVQRLPTTGWNTPESARVLNVTRVTNFTNCEKLPVLNNTYIMNPSECLVCELKKPLIKMTSEMHYNITVPEGTNPESGYVEDMLIEGVRLESEYMLEPFGSPEAGQVVTYVNSTFVLVESKTVVESIQLPSNMKKHETLTMQIPYLDMLERKLSWPTKSSPEKVLPKVRELLSTIISEPLDDKKKPEMVLYLVRLLEECTPEEIDTLISENLDKPINDKTRKMFFDVLPTLSGSPFVHEKLVRLIREDKLPKSRSRTILTTIGISGTPHRRVIRPLLDLCLSTSDFSIKKTACLAASAKIYDICRKTPLSYKKLQEKMCTQEDRNEYAKKLISLCKSANTEEMSLLGSKCLGNAGLKETLPYLIKLIEQPNKPRSELRSQHLYALRRFTSVYPKKIERMCMPIFTNVRETPEVRIAAYKMIMATKPHWSTFELIARVVRSDRSMQIKSFVQSHLWTLSNSSYPCCRIMLKHAQLALERIGKPVPTGMYLSKGIHFGVHSKQLEMGGVLDSSIIYSPESMIPRAFDMRLKTHVLGKEVELFEMGFHNEGLQKILSRLVGPKGSLYDSDPSESKHDEADSEPVTERRPEPKIMGHIFYKVFGRELDFASFDKETFSTLRYLSDILSKDTSSKLKRPSGYPLKLERTFVVPRMVHVIPTELGLPMFCNLSAVAIAKTEGMIWYDWSKEEKRIEGTIKMKPSVNSIVRGEFGVMHPSVLNYVKIDARLFKTQPISISGSMDSKDMSKSKIKIDMPEKDIKLVSLSVKPSTMCVKLSDKMSSDMPKRVVERTIKGSQMCKPFAKEFETMRTKLGLKYRVRVEANSRSCARYPVFHPLFGKQKIELYVTPLSSTPSKLTIDMTLKKTMSNIEESVVNRERPEYDNLNEDITKWEPDTSFADETESEDNDARVVKNDESSEEEESRERKTKKHHSSSRRSNRRSESHRRRSSYRRSSDSSRRHGRISRVDRPSRSSWSWINSWFDKKPLDTEFSSETPESNEFDLETSSEMEPSELRRLWDEELRSEDDENINDKDSYRWWKHTELKKKLSTSATKYVLSIKSYVTGPTSSKSSLCNVDLTYLNHPMTKKLHVSVDSTPFKLSLFSIMRLPLSPNSFTERLPESEQKIRLFTKVSFGRSLESSVNFHTTFEKSPEQREEESLHSTPEYDKCLKDRSEGRKYSSECVKLMKWESELRQMTSVIKYKNVPQTVKIVCSRMLRAVQYYFYEKWRLQDIDIRNPKDQITVITRLNKPCDQLDLMIETPKESSKFYKVNLPMPLSVPMYRTKFLIRFEERLSGNLLFSASCKITGNEVRTFDDVKMRVTSDNQALTRPSECDVVLAKDCSKDKLFTIKSRTISDDLKKVVKILLKNHVVKITPPKSDECPTVLLNGKDVTPSEIFEETLLESETSSTKLLKMKRVSKKELIVTSPKLGFAVYCDGKNIRIELSRFYQSKQCGICGDYNNEKTQEFVTPDKRLVEKPSDFVKSYTLGSCDKSPEDRISELYSPYDVFRQPESSIPERRSECELMSKTITRWVGNKICFSKRPVRVCSPHCSHATTEDVEVPFYCMDSSLALTQNWLEKINIGRTPSQLESKETTETMPVGEDLKCYY